MRDSMERQHMERSKTLDPREFDCIDCHVHVYTWADDEAERCLVCTWIHSMPDLTPEEEAEIRLMTATPIMEKKTNDAS
jgi:hypothetical protein